MTDGLQPVQFCDWCDDRQFKDESEMLEVCENVHICRDCAAELAFDNLMDHDTMSPKERVKNRA